MPETRRKTARRGRRKKLYETFYYMHHRYKFDVDKANALVRDGRYPVVVDDESVRLSQEGCHLTKEHIPTVDPTRPGIIAHVRYRMEDGQIIKGHVLIDGNHRAARCLELGRPFFAFVLTEEESQAVLLRSQLDEAPAAAQQREAAAV